MTRKELIKRVSHALYSAVFCMVSHESKELVLRMDRVCRLLFPLAFGAIVFSVFLR